MKTQMLFSVAMMAVLLVAGHACGQSTVGAGSSSYVVGPDGQGYLLVADGADGPAIDYGGVGLAGYTSGGACGCGDRGCAARGGGCAAPLGCDSKACGGCGGCGACTSGAWCHRVAVFADFLSLRPRNAETPFAVRSAGPITAVPAGGPSVPVQTSPVGNLDPDYDTGFRIGFGVTLDSCNEIRAAYTRFESSQAGAVSAQGLPLDDVVMPLAQHPMLFNAAAQGLVTNARQDIDFDLVDVDWRHLFSYSWDHRYAWVLGVRYARLDQNFTALNTLQPGSTTVTSNIGMDGIGVRLGFDGERNIYDPQLLGYLRTNANFVASEFRATYTQENVPPGGLQVNTGYNAGRIVTMLDLEVGGGWQSKCGNWRVTGGYLISAWFNTINNDEWINSVQTNNYVGLGSGLTFDGFVGRVEARF